MYVYAYDIKHLICVISVILAVTVPIIISHPNNVTANAYENVRFTCKIKSFEKVSITWKRVDQSRLPATARMRTRKLSGMTTISMLRITRINIYYGGGYYCIARNRFGTAFSYPGTLFVKGS